MGTPAIFLDRDGVVNENRADHVKGWQEFRFLPGVFQAVADLTRLGLPIFVVTNQAVVNRNILSREALEDIHVRMLSLLRGSGARVDAVLSCPHAPAERCNCRKPEPGLLLSAAKSYGIDLNRSVLVGDALTDVLAGKRAGCRTVLVLTGRGQSALDALHEDPSAIPDAVARDLRSAAPIVSRMVGEAEPDDAVGRSAPAEHVALPVRAQPRSDAPAVLLPAASKR